MRGDRDAPRHHRPHRDIRQGLRGGGRGPEEHLGERRRHRHHLDQPPRDPLRPREIREARQGGPPPPRHRLQEERRRAIREDRAGGGEKRRGDQKDRRHDSGDIDQQQRRPLHPRPETLHAAEIAGAEALSTSLNPSRSPLSNFEWLKGWSSRSPGSGFRGLESLPRTKFQAQKRLFLPLFCPDKPYCFLLFSGLKLIFIVGSITCLRNSELNYIMYFH